MTSGSVWLLTYILLTDFSYTVNGTIIFFVYVCYDAQSHSGLTESVTFVHIGQKVLQLNLTSFLTTAFTLIESCGLLWIQSLGPCWVIFTSTQHQDKAVAQLTLHKYVMSGHDFLQRTQKSRRLKWISSHNSKMDTLIKPSQEKIGSACRFGRTWPRLCEQEALRESFALFLRSPYGERQAERSNTQHQAPCWIAIWETALGTPARYRLAGSWAFSKSSVDRLITVCFKEEEKMGFCKNARKEMWKERQSARQLHTAGGTNTRAVLLTNKKKPLHVVIWFPNCKRQSSVYY